MNTKMLLSAVAAAVLGLSMGSVMAQDAVAPGPASAIKVTPAEKAAARAHRKAAAASAVKSGDVQTGEAAKNMAPAASGTKAERKAAHAAKRKELAAAEKKGDVAPAGEKPASK